MPAECASREERRGVGDPDDSQQREQPFGLGLKAHGGEAAVTPEAGAIWTTVGITLAKVSAFIVLMLVVGIVFTVIYLIIGLPGAILVGSLTGLLTLIPDVGPLIGTIVAVIVALLEGSTVLHVSNFWFAAIIVAIYAVLMIFKNIWLRPFIMGRAVRMHEGLVFVAIIAAVIYQGILGALIVVPVMASLAVLLGYARRRLLGLPAFPTEKPEKPIAPTEELPGISKLHPKRKNNNSLKDQK